ncbi:multi-sensor signal transduction histidine kinase [Thalassoporum mexicanum PCC 7367]|uniref:PAS domain S-box protein n=1 Tax=Thalassoporum mexicanum TaxID=3457544 RepID=UPI00029FB22E|nr:PAS domain S-box protein [Pseudanabaena sp. PCC 7367]AFY69580.1 multi-sensor signal transduction histidine kinase [Pseudanabaena sp. PCC 7367]
MQEQNTGDIQLQTFFAMSPNLLCAIAPEGHLHNINPAWRSILGWSETELQSRNWLELVHPEDLDATIAAHQLVNSCGLNAQGRSDRLEFEHRYQHKLGHYCWIKWNLCKDERGWIYGTGENITAQRQIWSELCDEVTDPDQSELCTTTYPSTELIVAQVRSNARELRAQHKRDRLIASITLSIHRSVELNAVLNTIVTEVREFLDCDRVLLYQFANSQVVAEAALPPWPTTLGNVAQAHCFNSEITRTYFQGQNLAIHNISQMQMPGCLLAVLEQLAVKAILVVPIQIDQNTWGLLIAHQCNAPRQWQSAEIELLAQLGMHVAIAIQKSELLWQVQTELVEREQIEAALHRSNSMLQAQQDAAVDGILVVDEQGRVIAYNHRFCQMWQISDAQIQQLQETELLRLVTDRLDLNSHSTALAESAETTVSCSHDQVWMHEGGVFDWHSVPVLSEQGNYQGRIWYFHDITEQVAANEELRQSRKRLQTVITNLPVILFGVDAKGVFTISEGQGLQDLGLVAGELVGQSVYEYYQDAPEVINDIDRALAGDSFRSIRQFNSITYEIWYTSLFDELDQVSGIIGVATNISDRQRTQQRLRQSEERYRWVVESLREVVFQTDELGIWTFLNPAWTASTGFSLSETINKNSLDFVHREDLNLYLSEFRRLVDQQIEYCHFELRCTSKKGHTIWFKVYAQLLTDDHGMAIGISGTLRDVTKTKEAAAKLEESEQFLRSIYTGVAESIFVFDVIWERARPDQVKEYRYVGLNPAHQKLTGLTNQDIQGKTPHQLFAPEIVADLIRHYDNCIDAGKSVTYEEWLPFQGQASWWLTTLTPWRDRNGKIYRIVGTSTNITERKKVESKLQELNIKLEQRVQERTLDLENLITQLRKEMRDRQAAESRFRNLVETSSDVVWEMNAELEYTYISPQISRVLGYEPEELIGRTAIALIATDQETDQELDQETNQELEHHNQAPEINQFPLIKPDQPFTCENMYIHKDNSIVTIETSGVPCYDPDGKIIGYRGIDRDISDRKRAEAEVYRTLEKQRQLYDLKTDFVTTVSHEFRTPLSIIMLAADMLEHSWHHLSQEKRIKRLVKIRQSVNAMTRLLEEVILIGQVEADKLTYKPEYIDLTAFCREIIEEIQLMSGDRPIIQFSLKIPDLEAEKICHQPAYVDPKLIRHIVSNLLTNAVKYSPEQKQVDFEITYKYIASLAEPLSQISQVSQTGSTSSSDSLPLPDSSAVKAEHTTQIAPSPPVATYSIDDHNVGNINPAADQPGQIPVAVIKVSDRGIGIPKIDQENLFESFYRAKNVGNISGTGLGLAIVKKAVDLQGGRISFQSEVNRGTTFTIELPIS